MSEGAPKSRTEDGVGNIERANIRSLVGSLRQQLNQLENIVKTGNRDPEDLRAAYVLLNSCLVKLEDVLK